MKSTTDRVPESQREPPKTELLPKAVRRLIFSLTLPTALLGGCAHHPAPPTELASTNPGKRIFRVGPSPDAQRRLDTYAASLPELSDSFSSAAIIEHILQRQKIITATPPGKPVRHGAKLRFPGAKADPDMAATTAGGVKIIAKVGSKKSHGRGRGGDHWDTVRGRMVLAEIEHEAVTAQLDHLRQHPGAVDFLMKRAEPYLPYLIEEINRHGLPADLVLVPMVESAFETAALSPKQAAGIWQFIPSTGQQYGLEVSETYDARYDVHASTQAALKYLKHLSRLFNGDWLLAFAAYNAGEGAVSRAIDASKKAGLGGGFWELSLPAETEAYVIKILSLAHVIADPEANGFKPRKGGSQPILTRVEVEPSVSIAEVLAASGMAPDELYKLNPAVKPDQPLPTGTRNLLIPTDKAQTLAVNLGGAKVYATRTVVVKKGETLAALAKRHGVPELKLAEWNGLKPKASLKAGQALVIYPA
ncbi:transglycosylase SLT domain-containing protein [Methylomagnum sp.]